MAAFSIATIVVWWLAWHDGFFYVLGLEGSASTALGPLLPAFSAGLTIALAGALGALANPTMGVITAAAVAAMPGFFALHRTSLTGPPLAALVMLMFAIMVHAPRFSIAYGTIAAAAAVLVAPEGLGLPIAALTWALMQPWRSGWPGVRRALLAVVPLLVIVLAARWTGDAWSASGPVEWAGGLDRGLRAAGRVLGDQLAPMIDNAALRWFAIADLALILAAVVAMAWRKVRIDWPPSAPLRRLFPAAAVIWMGMGVGMLARRLFLPGTPDPGLAAMFPLVAISTVVAAVSVAVLWRQWNRWAKLATVILALGWLQAAVRS